MYRVKRAIVVMGVSGCGKSGLGAALAERIGARLIEGDDYHSAASRDKMRQGIALTDDDRAAWLATLADLLREAPDSVVLSCSALKRAYRDRLRAAVADLRFVYLALDRDEALRRVGKRAGKHFFPVSLVDSQFATLEPPLAEPGVVALDATLPRAELLARAVAGCEAAGTAIEQSERKATMRMAMIGLGKMGGNMVRRLRRNGVEVVGYDRDAATVSALAAETAMQPAVSVADAVRQLAAPRVVWLMLPAGEATERQIDELAGLLAAGDVVVDGGNSYYKDSQRRGTWLAERGIGFMDAGTSGGVWGLDNGYCLMVGASAPVAQRLTPVLQALAPAPERGWAHVGPVGAGHYAKMLHNGIEYGMMQALAEGLDLLRHKREFDYDLAQLTELWRHGSVVRSWLLDLTAEALQSDQELANIAPHVADSGEGRWTVIDAVEQGVAAPVLTLALQMRFASQDQGGYANRLLALMRNAFGGHAIGKPRAQD